MTHSEKIGTTFKFIFLVAYFCTALVLNADSSDNANDDDDDPDIDPYNVSEEGCPVVSERDKLNTSKLSGIWNMQFASLNWLADFGMSLYNSSVKMSRITSICPHIVSGQQSSPDNNNANWTLRFVFPKLKGEFEIWCWYQNAKTKSKFICWNVKEAREMFLMIAATDQSNWLVLIRCSAKEPGKPAEGMSWALLSRNLEINSDVRDVLFGLLEGYGFDVEEFKVQLLYDDCPPGTDDSLHTN